MFCDSSGLWGPKENNAKCRQAIIDHCAWCADTIQEEYEVPCIFGDLCATLAPGTFKPGASFLQKFHAADRANLARTQWCYAHGRMCPLYDQHTDSDMETGGLPCPDYSLAGLGEKEEGPTNGVFFGFQLFQRLWLVGRIPGIVNVLFIIHMVCRFHPHLPGEGLTLNKVLKRCSEHLSSEPMCLQVPGPRQEAH